MSGKRERMPAVAAAAPVARVPADGMTRRRLLGGALAGALATALLRGEQPRGKPGPDRWKGKTRWIGHC
ncbi:MAG TPA: hypothetical protein VHE35_35995 [Kofleriaceae bacterium]|nr:hypothetical protein [Kofleriaceae bacterium]